MMYTDAKRRGYVLEEGETEPPEAFHGRCGSRKMRGG